MTKVIIPYSVNCPLLPDPPLMFLDGARFFSPLCSHVQLHIVRHFIRLNIVKRIDRVEKVERKVQRSLTIVNEPVALS